MECLGCGYALEGLRGGRCPECGRGFDPADRASYGPREVWRAPTWVLVLATAGAAWPVVLHAWAHVMLVAARLQLGRWPNRLGRDDPKELQFCGLEVIGGLVFLAAPGLMIVGIAAIGVLVWRDWRRGLACAAAAAGLLGGLWLVGDPCEVWVWLLD